MKLISFLLLVLAASCTVASAALTRDHAIVQKMLERLDDTEDLDDDSLQAIEQQLSLYYPDEENHRSLIEQLFPPYRTPKWWGRYKELIKRPYLRKCNSWIIDHEIPPRSGSIYCPRKTGNYTCFFGDQRCPELGRKDYIHPKVQCTCVDTHWRCHDWKCPEPFYYKTCPAENPFFSDDEIRCLGEYSCEYGEETCCGETHPSYKCDCSDGTFKCRETNACNGSQCPPQPDQLLETCPDTSPLGSNAICAKDLECTYGEKTCCDGDLTGPEQVCRCEEGSKFRCFNTDLCDDPKCPIATNKCPGQNPVESEKKYKCGKDLECPYGELRCCPTDDPVTSEFDCSCEEGSDFKCAKKALRCEGSCPDPKNPIDECPKKNPLDTKERFICATDLKCDDYGDLRCCDGDPPAGPETQCECTAGGELECKRRKLNCLFECPTETDTCPNKSPLETNKRFKCADKLEGDKEKLECSYGELKCCPGDIPISETDCSCEPGNELLCGKKVLDCFSPCPPEPNDIDECPDENPVNSNDRFTCTKPLQCPYGEFRCCPTDDPTSTTDCSCQEGESLQCFQKQFLCPSIPCPRVIDTCPKRDMTKTGERYICDGDFSCSYGEQRCCPGSEPPFTETDCTCKDGEQPTCTTKTLTCEGDCPPINVDKCPGGSPFGSTQDITCDVDLECEYGDFRCCPNDDPTKDIKCKCAAGEKMQCERELFFCPAVVCDSIRPIN